jgi:guanosine-3',5'-bis(diphosphate) 3'-pyrophosphohydrolase
VTLPTDAAPRPRTIGAVPTGQNETIDSTLERLLGLLERNGTPPGTLDEIRRTAEYARVAHDGQLRRSGEPYVIHPIEVATLVADLGAAVETIQAALLHDTVEDTPVTLEELHEQFGPEVRRLVDGCTKVARVHPGIGQAEAQAANLRKLFIALAEDTRVVVIKLCDRLHNLRTIEHLPEEKARRIGEETLAIHAPLAHRLGLGALKSELEDRAFAAAHPAEHQQLQRELEEDTELHTVLAYAGEILTEHLNRLGVTVTVSGRVKHLWSIKKKAERDAITPRALPDLLGLRVICQELDDCYRILAAVHDLWEPDLTRLKDYINRPKFNSYQSLHTTVTGPDGRRLEVQVRTRDMHNAAEHGTAAHYAYKNPGQHAEWLDRLVNWSDEATDDESYLAGVREELERRREILTLTPQGRVVRLPEGGTVVDFAYAVHSSIGDRCTGAKVDGRIVALSRVLVNGETVEILTGNRTGPSQEWLEWVVTAKARSRIRASLRTEPETPAVTVATTPATPKPPKVTHRSTDDLTPAVAGLRGTTIRIAGCCNPQPGTKIVGYAGKSSVNIHRTNCTTVNDALAGTPGRALDVHWVQRGHHIETVRIEAPPRTGILAEISAAVGGSGNVLREANTSGSELLLQIETDPKRQSRIRQALGLLEGIRIIK